MYAIKKSSTGEYLCSTGDEYDYFYWSEYGETQKLSVINDTQVRIFGYWYWDTFKGDTPFKEWVINTPEVIMRNENIKASKYTEDIVYSASIYAEDIVFCAYTNVTMGYIEYDWMLFNSEDNVSVDDLYEDAMILCGELSG